MRAANASGSLTLSPFHRAAYRVIALLPLLARLCPLCRANPRHYHLDKPPLLRCLGAAGETNLTLLLSSDTEPTWNMASRAEAGSCYDLCLYK